MVNLEKDRTLRSIFDDLEDLGAACVQLVARDTDDRPTEAVILVRGQPETGEVCEAVESATGAWVGEGAKAEKESEEASREEETSREDLLSGESPSAVAMQDLVPLMKKIQALVEDELDLDERPTVGVALALPPDYRQARFVTNTSRQEGIRLFTGAATSMQAQSN